MNIFSRVVIFLLLIVVTVLAGFWVAEQTAPEIEIAKKERRPITKVTSVPETAVTEEKQVEVEPPPLFLFVNTIDAADSSVVIEEIKMAANAGIHQYFTAVPLPWNLDDGGLKAIDNSLDLLLSTDPEARIFLYVKLDPPLSWLEANPDEAVQAEGNNQPFVCVSSEIWLDQVRSSLKMLMDHIDNSKAQDRLSGYTLSCLENGQWYRTGSRDTSPANLKAFRQWIATQYVDDAELQQSWGDAAATIATTEIPPMPETTNTNQVFFDLLSKDDKTPSLRSQVDYLHYVSESTAMTISTLVDHIKANTQPNIQVLASYGYSLEFASNDIGHFALGMLLESNIDGFVSPISYIDRGIGGAGGFMGPVDSAIYHGKQWYLIDDTRTGIARSSANGAVIDVRQLDGVYNVQLRNFSAAATHGLALCWSDPLGDGRLNHKTIWDRLAKIYTAYEELSESYQGTDAAPDSTTETRPLDELILSIVVDEPSRFYQQCDVPLNELLLIQLRDCALRAGVPVNFCLLQDIISGQATPASVYIFANAFLLSSDERNVLHSILAEQQATAIWMYAPGYISETTDSEKPILAASVENISSTTKITAKAFEGAGKSGSIWILKHEEQTGLSGVAFGAEMDWTPLFYIDDTGVDICAKYRKSEKVSIALKYFDEGWASIFCAEPHITVQVLKELLLISEQHRFIHQTAQDTSETLYLAPGILSIHAKDQGERIIDLGNRYNVTDLMNTSIGWPLKRALNLTLGLGETRLLRLIPSDE